MRRCSTQGELRDLAIEELESFEGLKESGKNDSGLNPEEVLTNALWKHGGIMLRTEERFIGSPGADRKRME